MFVRAAIPITLALLGLALFASGPVGRLLVAAGIVLFGPGYIVWSLVDVELRLPRLAAPALWLSLSLCIVPLLFLWSSTLGLRLTPAVLRGQALGVVLLAGWCWQRSGSRRVPLWLLGSWLGLLLLVAFTRAVEIRGVVLPLWVDSLHHTLLARIVAETGRIPTSLEPYMPVDPLVYHWGYHTVIATLKVVAALPIALAVLWGGQALNALMAVTMYGVASFLLRSPRAGLIAGGVVGLLSLFPAYYVTWGRYTQLTGLLVLPSLMIVLVALLERPTFDWRLCGLNALLLSGLMLIHYQVLTFYVVFAVVYAGVAIVQRPQQAGQVVARVAVMGTLAALLASPWVMTMVRKVLVPVAVQPQKLAGPADYNSVDWGLLLVGNNWLLFSLAGIGAIWAMLMARWRIVAVAAWVAALGVLANPTILGLPPSWFVTNQTVIIALFLPVGILAAFCIDQALIWLRPLVTRSVRPAAKLVGGAAAAAIALFGTWQLSGIPLPPAWNLNRFQIPVVNARTVLATPADMPALEWAATHTAPDARFLVNSADWLNGSPRGTDAGWWLLPLAQRWVTTPPAMYIYGDPAYKQAVEALNQRIRALQPTDQAALEQLVREQQITHVFLGKQGGPINPELLFGNPLFIPVYDADGVAIFAVRANP